MTPHGAGNDILMIAKGMVLNIFGPVNCGHRFGLLGG
jgi:hypothetical protein